MVRVDGDFTATEDHRRGRKANANPNDTPPQAGRGRSRYAVGGGTIKDGAVQQSNILDYGVPRMHDIPELHIKLIATPNRPTGAGQMATPVVAPAIASAVFAANGARVRHTPFLPERVRAAMA